VTTVLFIDDQPGFREPFELALRRDGFEVVSASGGVAGLGEMRRRAPDLVLLDLKMPGLDGLSVLRAMRAIEHLRLVPVIMLSGFANRDTVLEAAKLGVKDYILKSRLTISNLIEKVRSRLSGPAAPAGGPADTAAARPEAGPAATAPAPLAEPAPPPDPGAGLRALKPVLSRASLIEKIGAFGQLRALSPTVAHVLKLTGNERASIETVAKAISHDQAIALRILKLANSAVFTRGQPVDSVNKAVIRIGIERIRQALLNISVIDQFTAEAFQGQLDTLQFWEHSIAVGLIAAELAHAQDPGRADASFAMGLLHDVGRLVFAEQLGPMYVEVLRGAAALGVPVEQVESRMLLMSHADAMEQVLQTWNFPADLAGPIVHHHLSAANARRAAPRQLHDILRLGLADRLAHALLLGCSGNATIYPIHEHCKALALDAPVIARVEETARQQTDDVKFAMLTSSNGKVWARPAEALRASLPGPLRPLVVCAEPEFDPVRMFCAAIADPPGDEPPTIAIVSLTDARDSARLASSLASLEQERNVGPLPTLLVSSGGKIADGPFSGGRRVESLTLPISASRLVGAIAMLQSERPS
jgi:HD-like signal output (HDOD) protein/CheY-like chemotaxis protein